MGYKIALVGNPNSGKTSLFNVLTGLRQKVGNYPGITVDKKTGFATGANGTEFEIIDLPGTYSLYPNSSDELLVSEILANPKNKLFPDALLYVCDVTSIQKHLLLFTQILDLKLPTILVLTMADQTEQSKKNLDLSIVEEKFGVPICLVSNRTEEGIDHLKLSMESLSEQQGRIRQNIFPIQNGLHKLSSAIQKATGIKNEFQALLIANHFKSFDFLTDQKKEEIRSINQANDFNPLKHQIDETLYRFDEFEPVISEALGQNKVKFTNSLTDRLDQIFTHRFLGPLIFLLIMVFVFQAIFAWAEWPMGLIESMFGWISEGVENVLPDSWFRNLLTEGIIAGITGVVIFIPQIAILFFLITLLEEMGYMARVVYLFDRLMQSFGLNGRSMVALISSGACAIPAIMSARTISNPKERLITILVSPFISCAARIPVYIVLVAFVVPSYTVFGIFNSQGLMFMGLYLLGIAAALITSFIFHLILKSSQRSLLTLELPAYKPPILKNVLFTVYEKIKSFIIEAGKVIFIISIILWFLSSYGMPSKMEQAEADAIVYAQEAQFSESETNQHVNAKKLENSFAGQFGKLIEPAIRPLGYDWKIGIALLTSFAAREVFVGTMATIYSVGDEEDTTTLREKMQREVWPDGTKIFSMATSLSLLLFYVFAMQCMSTLAVVKRETKSWKWPIIQFFFMTALAYISALLAYQLLS